MRLGLIYFIGSFLFLVIHQVLAMEDQDSEFLGIPDDKQHKTLREIQEKEKCLTYIKNLLDTKLNTHDADVICLDESEDFDNRKKEVSVDILSFLLEKIINIENSYLERIERLEGVNQDLKKQKDYLKRENTRLFFKYSASVMQNIAYKKYFEMLKDQNGAEH
jgi:hypothetical protein